MRQICRVYVRVTLGTVAAMASLAVSGCIAVSADYSQFSDRHEQRFVVSGTADLTLSSTDGSITVRQWDRPEVLVLVERTSGTEAGLRDFEIDSRQEGNRITRRVRPGRDHPG